MAFEIRPPRPPQRRRTPIPGCRITFAQRGAASLVLDLTGALRREIARHHRLAVFETGRARRSGRRQSHS